MEKRGKTIQYKMVLRKGDILRIPNGTPVWLQVSKEDRLAFDPQYIVGFVLAGGSEFESSVHQYVVGVPRAGKVVAINHLVYRPGQ